MLDMHSLFLGITCRTTQRRKTGTTIIRRTPTPFRAGSARDAQDLCFHKKKLGKGPVVWKSVPVLGLSQGFVWNCRLIFLSDSVARCAQNLQNVIALNRLDIVSDFQSSSSHTTCRDSAL
jgi:hypothetical protein